MGMSGLAYMLAGSAFFSVSFLFVHMLTGVSVLLIVFWRSVVQIACSFTFYLLDMIVNRQCYVIFGRSRSLMIPLIWRSIFGAIAIGCFYLSIEWLSLPDAVTLQFTVPLFSGLIAATFLREPWHNLDKIGAAVCLMGVALLTRPSFLIQWFSFGASDGGVAATTSDDHSDDEADYADLVRRLIAILTGLAGAFFASAAYCMVRYMGVKVTANEMTAMYAVVSVLATPFTSLMLFGTMTTCWNGATTLKMELLLGLGAAAFLGQLFTNLGLQREKAGRATLCTTSQIVFAYLFDILLLHEPLNAWSIAGSLMITCYMAILFFASARQEGQDYEAIPQ
jgi:drug/metabolite transporter (DMT)-like permease